VGGSGYYANNAGVTPTTNNFLQRLSYSTLANQDFTVHVTCGGINDADTANVATNSTAYFTLLRSMYPTTVLVATAPWSPLQSNATSGPYPGVRDKIYAGMSAVNGPWCFIDNLLGTWVNSTGKSGSAGNLTWQTGSGRAGATTGTGNGDLYVSSDGTHPSTAGIAYLADRLTTSIRDSILAL
jgi:lysophospholipase L1-like esterase